MNSLPANNPDWLVKKIKKMGGTISFYDFMNFALNDPINGCLLYTSPSPRDRTRSRMPSSA